MAIADDLIGFFKKAIAQYLYVTPPDSYEAFFKDALFLNASDARLVAYCYLATCDVFDVAPGLGKPKANARTRALPADLQAEFNKLGLGKFSTGLISQTFSMKLSDYFSEHQNAASAKRALTPAKRDALKAEAAKLAQVPAKAWQRYYDVVRFATVGVRG